MRKVNLRMNEQEKYEVIKNLVEKDGNKIKASIKLGLSQRQINRLIKIYKEKGKSGFVHGNRSKQPSNTLDNSISNDIVTLYENKYLEFNFTHFKDMLLEDENIDVSYFKIYNTLTSNGLYSPKMQKKTKRMIKRKELQKSKPELPEKELDEAVDYEINIEDAHPRKERCKYFGELLQMDASHHLWFGNFKAHLHLAIDDASGRLVGGHFETQETLNGYYNVYYQILTNYGIPLEFLTDNRTIFKYNSYKNKQEDKDVLTQFGYACKTLGTGLETTSVPQAKGRIERAFGTLQSRLIQELKLNGISTIEEANKYLANVFIPKFNDRFSLPLKNFESVFEESPDKEKIMNTLAVISLRKIDNGNSVKYNNKIYQSYDEKSKICLKPKTEVLVIKTFDNRLLVSAGDKLYRLEELKRNAVESVRMDHFLEKPKEKNQYIPPMSHPWKSNSFKKHIEKAHIERTYA